MRISLRKQLGPVSLLLITRKLDSFCGGSPSCCRPRDTTSLPTGRKENSSGNIWKHSHAPRSSRRRGSVPDVLEPNRREAAALPRSLTSFSPYSGQPAGGHPSARARDNTTYKIESFSPSPLLESRTGRGPRRAGFRSGIILFFFPISR